MSNEIIVALIAFLGTVAGSSFGVFAAGKLTNHRLQELEKKVDRHNNAIERIVVAEEQIKAAARRIDALEEVSRGFV